MKNSKIFYIFIALQFLNAGCKKIMSEKSDASLVVISNLTDLQALLDRPQNAGFPGGDTGSANDFFLSTTNFLALGFEEYKNMYTWKGDHVFVPFTTTGNDWSKAYHIVYLSNTVLESLEKIERTTANALTYDNIKGQALYMRGYAFSKIAFVWCLAYDETTADQDLDIPLRLNTNFNEATQRSSLRETYQQILSDLQAASILLPPLPLHVYRGSASSAYGLLSRVYLYMHKYELAANNATACLNIKAELIDYNTLSTTAIYPLTQFNKEVLFDSASDGPAIASRSIARIDPVLYASYDATDLRKRIFFDLQSDGNYAFRGSYWGSGTLFNGVPIDEMYLNRAEAFARIGQTANALADLNLFAIKTYQTGTYVAYTTTVASELLSIILRERRKELVMRETVGWMLSV
jgi:hypothetical protein